MNVLSKYWYQWPRRVIQPFSNPASAMRPNIILSAHVYIIFISHITLSLRKVSLVLFKHYEPLQREQLYSDPKKGLFLLFHLNFSFLTSIIRKKQTFPLQSFSPLFWLHSIQQTLHWSGHLLRLIAHIGDFLLHSIPWNMKERDNGGTSWFFFFYFYWLSANKMSLLLDSWLRSTGSCVWFAANTMLFWFCHFVV